MKAIKPTNFHGVILGGLAVAAVGAGVSAYGTSQNAKAVGDAAQFAGLLENKFAKKQQVKVDALVADKEEKLKGISTILDRFEGSGAFGSSDVLKNIREAQSEFSQLGAGDFSGFQDQLDSILKGTLANTYGAGAAQGTFTQLAADTIMNLRQGGLQSALQTGEFLSRESQQLLGTEFGIMDQGFEQQYMIERNRISGITGSQMIQAQQAGIGTQALGGVISQVGGGIAQYGAYKQQMDQVAKQQGIANTFQDRMLGIQENRLGITTPTLNQPNLNTGGGGGGGGAGAGGTPYFDAALPTGGGGGSSVNPAYGAGDNFLYRLGRSIPNIGGVGNAALSSLWGSYDSLPAGLRLSPQDYFSGSNPLLQDKPIY